MSISTLTLPRKAFRRGSKFCAITAIVVAGLMGVFAPTRADAQSLHSCESYTITGYVRGHHSNFTANGTSVWTREWVAAGSYNLPFNTVVQVQFPNGPAEYRIVDRGHLNNRHIDILVDTVDEARNLTATRMVCIVG